MNQIKQVFGAAATPMHYMSRQNLLGTFGLATPEQALFTQSSNPSVTSDGTFLYICGEKNSQTMMYKVGTGENTTIAGKVYLAATIHSTRCQFSQWVFCSGKLYGRRSDEPLGLLQVVDPCTFKREETLRLDFKLPSTDLNTFTSCNLNMPLLTDGQKLYTITVTPEKRRKLVKNDNLTEYDELVRKISTVVKD